MRPLKEHDPGKAGKTRVPEQVLSRLRTVLTERGYLTADALRKCEQDADWLNGDSIKIALDENIIAEDELLAIISEITGLPRVRIADAPVTMDAVNKVPARVASRFHIMPLQADEEAITLASDLIHGIPADDSLRVLLGRPVRWVLCTSREVAECIKHHYGVAVGSFLDLQSQEEQRKAPPRGAARAPIDIASFVSEIIRDAVHSGATDIHFEPYEKEFRLRYRIDGALSTVPLPFGAGTYRKAVVSSIKVLAQMNIAEHRLPQDGRFSVKVDADDLDLRVSVLPTRYGEAAELRILNREAAFLQIEDIGLSAEQRRLLDSLMLRSNGMILFTGPTGSGKTTSLYAALAAVNAQERKIVTLEDPIEYQIKGIVQLQVEPEVGFTFGSGLRSVLRHDPDVILVGEIRDTETADIAVKSALTGHLVLSTLHTNDSPSAVVRLLDMGVEPYLVASAIQGVVAQRLVRQICGTCKQQVADDDWAATMAQSLEGANSDPFPLYRGIGCPDCRYTGYRGRKAIFEVLKMNDALRAMVVEHAPGSALMGEAVRQGLTTLRERGLACVRNGTSTLEEVVRLTAADA